MASIFDGLTRQRVLNAMEIIAKEGVPPGRKSRGYCLEMGGRHYPPKYVVSVATRGLASGELGPDQFNGGKPTNGALRDLGFKVVDCHCGGANVGVA